MKQNNKAMTTSYLKQIREALVCSNSIKKVFLGEIKNQIAELETQNPILTMEILHREIGSPEEIANSFESKEDLDRIKAKARKYTRIKIICAVCLVLVALVSAIMISIVYQNDNYRSDLEINSYVEKEFIS